MKSDSKPQAPTRFLDVCFAFLLMVPLVKPEYFSTLTHINTAYNVMRILAAIVITGIYIWRGRLSKILIVLLAFQLWLVLISLINGTGTAFLTPLMYVLLFAMLIDSYADRMDILFRAFMALFECLIYCNFLTLLLFPDGLYMTATTANNWFLGYDNTHIAIFLPALCVAVLYGHFFHKRLRPFCLIAVIYVTTFITRPSTALVGLVLAGVLFLLPFVKKHPGLFNFRNFVIVAGVLFLLIVILRLQNWFSFILVDILHKDLTLSSRTMLWDITWRYIQEKWLFGWGCLSEELRHAQYNSSSILSAHNQILEYMFQGGVVQLVLYGGLLYTAGRPLMRYKDSPFAQTIAISLFAVLIMQLTEVYTQATVYALFILAYYAGNIIEQYDSLEEGRTVRAGMVKHCYSRL